MVWVCIVFSCRRGVLGCLVWCCVVVLFGCVCWLWSGWFDWVVVGEYAWVVASFGLLCCCGVVVRGVGVVFEYLIVCGCFE